MKRNFHIRVSKLLLAILALALICGAAWAGWQSEDEELLLLLQSRESVPFLTAAGEQFTDSGGKAFYVRP